MFPTVAQYNQAIQTKGARVLSTLSNLIFTPSRTTPFKIYSYGSGSYAVVFKATDNSSDYAIRCFISAEGDKIERYRAITSYLNGVSTSWITNIELLEDEINIDGKYYPIIKMDWVNGRLLNSYITDILHDNESLTQLQKEIITVSKSLEKHKIGHGDIQCGNVIVTKNAKGKRIIKLIDYDGMYIPSLSNRVNLERGRTEFQHPNRSMTLYDEKIDRFSFWVIICAIEALKYDKSLWLEVMQGGFNTLDNMLFVGDDFQFFSHSKLVARLYALNQPSLTFYLNRLNQFCTSSADKVAYPVLFKLSEEEISDDIPIIPKIHNYNYSSKVKVTSTPEGASVFNRALQPIGITPLVIDKTEYKSLVIVYENTRTIIELTEDTKELHVDFTDYYKQTPSLPKEGKEPIFDDYYTTSGSTSPPQQDTPKTHDYTPWMILTVVIAAFVFVFFKNHIDSNSQDSSSTPTINLVDSTKIDSAAILPIEVPVDAAAMAPAVDSTAVDTVENLPEVSEDDLGFKTIKQRSIFTIKKDNDCGIHEGKMRIDRIVNNRFSFALAVDGEKDIDNLGMEGRVKGIATLIDNHTAIYNSQGMTLTFYFKENDEVEVLENSSEFLYYHGAGICFSGVYSKAISEY